MSVSRGSWTQLNHILAFCQYVRKIMLFPQSCQWAIGYRVFPASDTSCLPCTFLHGKYPRPRHWSKKKVQRKTWQSDIQTSQWGFAELNLRLQDQYSWMNCWIKTWPKNGAEEPTFLCRIKEKPYSRPDQRCQCEISDSFGQVRSACFFEVKSVASMHNLGIVQVIVHWATNIELFQWYYRANNIEPQPCDL